MTRPSSLSKKKNGPSPVGGVVRLLIWITLPLAFLYGLVWWRADAGIEKQLDKLKATADIRRGGTVLGLNGDVGVKDLVVRPLPSADDSGVSFKAERLVLRTPGLGWLIRSSLFGMPDEIPSRFGFRIERGELEGSDAAMEKLLDGRYGGTVFFPFDFAGCGSATDVEMLKGLGLDKATMSIDALMTHPDSDDVQLRIEVDNSAQARIEMEIDLELGAGKDATRMATASLRSVKISLNDLGFMEKRNSYCAQRLGTTTEEFAARHLEASRLWFAAEKSLLPGAAMSQAYGRFAERGGTLTIQAKPLEHGPLAAMRGMQLRNLDAYLNATVQHDDDFPAPVVFLPADDYRKPETAPANNAVPPPPNPVAMVAPGQEVPFDDLSAYLGARLSVSTVHKTIRSGTLQGASSLSIVLKLDAGDGGYPLTVPRDAAVKVVLLSLPPATNSGNSPHAETQ